eukprot:gene4470-4717_t
MGVIGEAVSIHVADQFCGLEADKISQVAASEYIATVNLQKFLDGVRALRASHVTLLDATQQVRPAHGGGTDYVTALQVAQIMESLGEALASLR